MQTRQMLAIVLVLVSQAMYSFAQGNVPSVPYAEFGFGYEFNSVSLNGAQTLVNNLTNSLTPPLPQITLDGRLATHGGNLSVEGNVNHWLGGTFDFGGTFTTFHFDLSQVASALHLVPLGTTVTATLRPHILTFVGGPQVHFRRDEKIQPFARVLLGGAYAHLSPDSLTAEAATIAAPQFTTNSHSFAALGGVGIDYWWAKYAAVRVTTDYARTYLFGQHQGNVRFTVGMNFRVGDL